MRRTQRGMRKGFTLVEMMIVVAIIAILAGIAVPNFTKSMRKSETTEAIRLMKQIADAEGTFFSTHGKYIGDTGADTDNGMEKLGLELNTDGEFKYFKILNCASSAAAGSDNTGTTENKGVIITASTDAAYASDKTVYMFYPKGLITLTDDNAKDYYEGSAYLFDYINSEGAKGDNAPTCTE
ncbi:MAG: prepilin-type N-terminal cleavage/methylation domain-containing protein [Campylobacterota bacterium]|nr:prepilin-type N-terminal cleavage/methylation domain-containing protein [Campylobacterota bacterium]